MLKLITGALSGAWGYIAAAGGALVAVLALLYSAKKAGKDEVIAASATKEAENARTANEIDREVSTSKPAANRERLRKYQRD